MHSVHSSRLWCANCSNKNDSLDPLRPVALNFHIFIFSKYFQNIPKYFKIIQNISNENHIHIQIEAMFLRRLALCNNLPSLRGPFLILKY